MIPQNTHLTRQQLSLCVSLVENGVNAEALAVRIFLLFGRLKRVLVARLRFLGTTSKN